MVTDSFGGSAGQMWNAGIELDNVSIGTVYTIGLVDNNTANTRLDKLGIMESNSLFTTSYLDGVNEGNQNAPSSPAYPNGINFKQVDFPITIPTSFPTTMNLTYTIN
jgi:hypothetical protein